MTPVRNTRSTQFGPVLRAISDEISSPSVELKMNEKVPSCTSPSTDVSTWLTV